MKYFRRIKHHINVRPLLDEIYTHPDPWAINASRQSKIKVQRESQAIPIRDRIKFKNESRKAWDVHESRFTLVSRSFPEAVSFLTVFAAECNAEFGRAKIVKLGPGCRVYPHLDRGEYYRIRDRYHLVLASVDGSPLKSGGEEVRMREGELWWFDNKQTHEAYNDSIEDRIHFIFDLLPPEKERG